MANLSKRVKVQQRIDRDYNNKRGGRMETMIGKDTLPDGSPVKGARRTTGQVARQSLTKLNAETGSKASRGPSTRKPSAPKRDSKPRGTTARKRGGK